MKRQNKLDTEVVVASATVASIAALAAYFALSALAKPAHYKDRLAAIQTQYSQTQALMRSPGEVGVYSSKALCHVSPDQAALDLRQRLQAQGAATGVTISEVAATPETPQDAEARLVPVRIQFGGSGRYEAVLGLLGGLSKSGPEIFIDTLDLAPDVANAKLKLTGRILCSISARP
jgi:hypothetical protein